MQFPETPLNKFNAPFFMQQTIQLTHLYGVGDVYLNNFMGQETSGA